MTSPEYKKVQAAQATNLRRRLAEIEAGKAKFIPGDEVMKRLRRRNGKKT
jgi:putative addiction module component (TIGR02574 family)